MDPGDGVRGPKPTISSGRYRACKQKRIACRADYPFSNGANGIRTHDLCVANAALSQLSYDPVFIEPITSQRLINLISFNSYPQAFI